MTPPLARSLTEAAVYQELHPCEVCGESAFDPTPTVVEVDGVVASRFAGACPSCGTDREFTFRLPPDAPAPDPVEPRFGDDEPSELLDAGQWLWLANRVASNSIAEPSDKLTPRERELARFALRFAAAAVAEALKFVPPGADAVPPDLLWSQAGRASYAEDPGQFNLGQLQTVRESYRTLADQFTA